MKPFLTFLKNTLHIPSPTPALVFLFPFPFFTFLHIIYQGILLTQGSNLCLQKPSLAPPRKRIDLEENTRLEEERQVRPTSGKAPGLHLEPMEVRIQQPPGDQKAIMLRDLFEGPPHVSRALYGPKERVSQRMTKTGLFTNLQG